MSHQVNGGEVDNPPAPRGATCTGSLSPFLPGSSPDCCSGGEDCAARNQ